MSFPDISEYYDQGDLAQREHAAWIAGHKEVYEADFVNRHAKGKDISEVMELGPGSGLLARALCKTHPDWFYVAHEKSAQMCALFLQFPKPENLHLSQLDLRTVGHTADLVICFSVLKHFNLDEWDAILTHVLKRGHYAAIDMNILDHDLEDGLHFPHVYVTEERLARVIEQAGHAVRAREVWQQSHLNGHGQLLEVNFWTERVA